MATAWVTGVCLQPNRLEWTVLRRAKDSWEKFSQGQAEWPEGEKLTPEVLKPYTRQFRGKVAVAMPLGRVLVRMALLPSQDAAELRGMVELQTDKFSPFPVETILWGAEVLESSGTSSLVAMAVVRREEIDALGQTFQGAGILPDKVDVEALGWWWSLRNSGIIPGRGAQLIWRVGAKSSDLTVVRDGVPLLFRQMPPRPGGESAEAWLAETAEEMTDSLTALETEWGALEAPSLYIFHPAGAPVAGVQAILKPALGLADIFPHELDPMPAASEGIARRLVLSGPGLAMDLAPEEWHLADVARQTRRRLLRAATIFLAVWAAGLGIFWTLLNLQRGRLVRLQREVEAMEGPALEVRRLRAKVREFTQYADRAHSALECLREVTLALPAGMDLTSFIYRKGSQLTLRGEADSPEKVYAFIQALERTGRYPEVKSEGISTRSTPQGALSQFTISILLPGAGEGTP